MIGVRFVNKGFNRSIQGKLFLSFLSLTLVCSILISIGAYTVTYGFIRKRVGESFLLTLDSVSGSITNEIKQIKTLSDYLFVNNDVKAALTYTGSDKSEIYSYRQNAYNALREYSISHVFKDVNYISIYGINGFELTYSLNYGDIAPNGFYTDYEEWIDKLKTASGQQVMGGITSQSLGAYSNNNLIIRDIPLFRVLKGEHYREDVGLMVISINLRAFTSLLGKYNDNYPNYANACNVFLIDGKHEVINQEDCTLTSDEISEIVASDASKSETGFKIKHLNSIAYLKPLANNDFYLIGIIPDSFLGSDSNYVLYMTLLAFILSFIACGIIWFYVSSSIFKPIKNIAYTMKKIEYGEKNLYIDVISQDEIGELGKNINSMLKRLEDLHIENLNRELKMRDLQYSSRQYQMSPHFIYNTLNSIKWMAKMAGNESIQQAISSFWTIAKYNSNIDKYFSKIKDEIEAVKQYIYLQELSYPNKLKVNWDINQELLDCRCIRFFLQPLVENAIIHGVYPKETGGTIYISVYKENERVVFNIYDDGVGMSHDTIDEILNTANDSDNSETKHMALSNIIERFKLVYQDNCTIDILSEISQYTNITITFPVEYKDKSDIVETNS